MNTRFKRFLESLVEGLLTISGTVTTFTVLLIVLFLFREGASLFSTSPVENNNLLVVNAGNPVSHLSATQCKDIFDQKITHWNEIGGKPDSIRIVTINELTNYFSEEELGAEFEFLPDRINQLVDSFPDILAVINAKYRNASFPGKIIEIDKNNLPDFLGGKEW
ncbi:MAG TPA: phosphate ABC transporter permease subunit PstC, partial [Bacteroidia bacterium]|nr:phosphate ABC transporter permease subunit PstC [Bacteroidia bacterium]